MTSSVKEHGGKTRGESRHALIDCDVHAYTEGLSSVYPYMPTSWRRRFELKGSEHQAAFLTVRFNNPAGEGLRRDALAPGTTVPGSDPVFVAEDLLDRYNVERCILNSLEAATLASATAGPDESNVLCAAYNDYFLERWSGTDARFGYAICVSPQDVEGAVSEIYRLAGRAGVEAIYLPQTNVLLGNRYFHPVYRAAEDVGLPIVLHVSGGEAIYQGAPAPIGQPETFAERRVSFGQFGMASLASLVFSGTLVKFPHLRITYLEYGFTWLVPLLWRMDNTWQHTRIEVPWLVERPSAYVARQVRFSTQPLDEPDDPRQLRQLLGLVDPAMIVFSTDYPHWDNDVPDHVLRVFPEENRRAVGYENAAKWFPRT